MEDSEDIKRLLSEIRDIQKAHYERYLVVTEELLESERRTSAENERHLRRVGGAFHAQTEEQLLHDPRIST